MIARDSASQLLGKRSHENVDDAAGEAEVRRQEEIQNTQLPLIVKEAPANAYAGLPGLNE